MVFANQEGCRRKYFFSEITRSGLTHDAITYNILIEAYCREGNSQEVSQLLDLMVGKGILPNASTYNAIVNGLRKGGKYQAADRILSELLETGFRFPGRLRLN